MNWLRRGRHLAIGGKKDRQRKNKTESDGVKWEEKAAESEEGGGLMVKGLSRRVIVVKAPDEKVFEQAIFIIREDFASTAGVSEKEVLRQARRAANEYLGSSGCGSGKRLLRYLKPPLYAAAGAAATAAAWFALHLVKV